MKDVSRYTTRRYSMTLIACRSHYVILGNYGAVYSFTASEIFMLVLHLTKLEINYLSLQ